MTKVSSHRPFSTQRINTGPWIAGYSLEALRECLAGQRIALPVCSLGTAEEELAALAPFVLPPLYHEALAPDAELKAQLVEQVRRCFPFFDGTHARTEFRGSIEVVELPPRRNPPPRPQPAVLAFGVDTTVEQHGPHLPLGTDTIQTYAVLERLARDDGRVAIGPALEYGHLTWGLPFGCSVDLTATLLARYAKAFLDALVTWCEPGALYVADVHGSVVHRATIQDALQRTRCARGAFRWLHDPLAEFAGQRGDMHAGGVETALVEFIDPALVDERWWPGRVDELAAGQMSVAEVLPLSADLPRFIARVEAGGLNGIVGDIRNAFGLDARELFERMLAVARADVAKLVR